MSSIPMREGELVFDFAGAVSAKRLDEQGVPLPARWKFVDFVVEEEQRRLLVEVKDPMASAVPPANQLQYLKDLRGDMLVAEQFVPKCRDSYCFLHLMAEDNKPCDYVMLIGSGSTPLDPAMLLALGDRVRRRARKEAADPWRRQYVRDVAVMDVQQWQRLMAYPLRREP